MKKKDLAHFKVPHRRGLLIVLLRENSQQLLKDKRLKRGWGESLTI